MLVTAILFLHCYNNVTVFIMLQGEERRGCPLMAKRVLSKRSVAVAIVVNLCEISTCCLRHWNTIFAFYWQDARRAYAGI